MRSGSNETGRGAGLDNSEEQKCSGDNGSGEGFSGKGYLKIVGLGPGDECLMAPQALEAIHQADVVVGYTGYIKLIAPNLLEGKEVLSTGMMAEVERCRRAVDEALSGKKVVMVCSGDPGIYAMAGLVMELLEVRDLFRDICFEVVPGIPAFVAAAALLGAPLMHDFASVSLSDLLTPWDKIEKRLKCAADADFVIAIYNPRSKKRAGHLNDAIRIIKTFRSGTTPVGIVNKAYREGQRVQLVTLDTVNEQDVDMQTVLIIGNSSTRAVSGKMLTPRGYAGKYDI
ncbi:precorrin-3B C(17)-methyltransferase [Maridesulfovibrio ferrireducens]|uniref:precorrin-3B C(17)-methyltransferase n=1 Tax=Maridesulfovibrio ferrireducens TaxID=246191 RepID=UPI000B82043B|nr:precorrin-3B C(17)-methyltransferase [Maridesulfovibrio ferrireducens]